MEGFFARNIADIRPLFEWLPVLLIFLSAALTMRLWSEEQKLGTLEVLFTLPVDTHHLVLGKFMAALTLVAVALGLTFSVPVTVSFMGDLDWGPVFGGYLAGLLLAGAYLAIGLCISSMTENQILALMGTTIVCTLFYVVGADWVTQNASSGVLAEVLRSMGTGARFESIRRGVIDIRDLAYYGSIIAAFLALNVVLLKAKTWSHGARTRAQRNGATTMALLVILNAIAINVLLAPVAAVRVDMTERGEYSVSDVTKKMLRGLNEPLLIRGYFSEKTHPLLDPMVPRIKDMIEEYGVVSGGKVKTEYIDPRKDEAVEKEANQLYGIKSFPFRISSRHDDSVVNAYFSILVKYGDQYQVLNFSDLIEVKASGLTNIEVKLRNLEYDLTRAVKKVAYGFQTLDAVFADLDKPAEFYAFISANGLPQNFKEVPDRVKKILNDLKKEAGDKFNFEIIDPDAEGAKETRDTLFQKYGFKPYATSLFAKESFYLHLLLKVGDKYQLVAPGDSMSEADLKNEIVAAIKRAAPGFLKTIGFVKPKAPPPNPQLPPQLRAQQQQMQDVTRLVNKQLTDTYTVKDVDLTSGRVPGDIDVLVVYNPKDFDDKQRFALDQYLMRGGAVILMAGRYELDPMAQGAVSVKAVNSGLDEMLAGYGVTVENELVMDVQNEPFPIPTTRDLGGFKIREMKLVNYPFFIDIRPDGMDKENPVTAGLPAVTMQWASPVTVSAPKADDKDAPKREVWELLKSSEKSWTTSNSQVQPNFDTHGELGFEKGTDTKRRLLGVAVKGSFDSFFKDKKDPTAQGGGGQVLKRSPGSARLVVIGSASFVNDMVLGISRQGGSDRFTNNLQLVQNLVDWGVEDVELLSIRSRGTFARTLLPKEARPGELEDSTFEVVNYAFVALALGLIVVLTLGRRKRMRPIALDPSVKAELEKEA